MKTTEPPAQSGIDNLLTIVLVALLALLVVLVVVFLSLIGASPWSLLVSLAGALFATNTEQALWYVTRAAGLIAYLLLWFATVWGVAVSSKLLDPLLDRAITYDFHQFVSLLALGFTGLHVAVLLGDKYLPFTWAQILIPFAAPYRPLWTGVGVIGAYLAILVSATFYIRSRIGKRAFRAIHYLSFLAFGGSALHGLLAGTDSPLAAVRMMYAATTLVAVFFTLYRILTALPVGQERRAGTANAE